LEHTHFVNLTFSQVPAPVPAPVREEVEENEESEVQEDTTTATAVEPESENDTRASNWALDDEESLLLLLQRFNFEYGQILLSFQNDLRVVLRKLKCP